MHISSLDPSMVIGFYIKTRQDYTDFKENSAAVHFFVDVDLLITDFYRQPAYIHIC
jgi:hypothetical protein